MNRQSCLALLSLQDLRIGDVRAQRSDVWDIISASVASGSPPPLDAAQTQVPASRPSLDPDHRVAESPLLRPYLARARVYQIADLAGVKGDVAETVVADLSDADRIDDLALRRLVDRGVVTAEVGRDLGSASAIYEVAERDVALAEAIRDASATLGRTGRSPAELAAVDAAAWAAALVRSGVAVPGAVAAEDAGRLLARRWAALEPEAAFFGRLPRSLPSTSEEAALYPGLGIAEVIADTSVSARDRDDVIARRVGLLRAVAGKSSGKGVLALDLSPDSSDIEGLELATAADANGDAKRVLATLKAYQRVYALTGDVDAAHALLRAGYSSASQVATATFDAFRATVPFDTDTSRRYWGAAREIFAGATGAASALVDVETGMFDAMRVGNVAAAVPDWLRKLDGYETLFGSQSFCNCDDCKSVLGPAAYFVDLMKFVDDHVQPQFEGNEGHVFNLRQRRPDLWARPLTCANTNDLISKLQISNEIIENTVGGGGGNPEDRSQIAHVYDSILRTRLVTFGLPFHLPLTRIRAYLGELGGSRSQVARVVAAPGSHAALLGQLGLAPEEWGRLTLATVSLVDVSERYATEFTETAGSIEPIETRTLLRSMFITREDLGDVVDSLYLSHEAPRPVIVQRKRDTSSVQLDLEEVQGLTIANLERMYRFLHVRRAIGCTVLELDVLLEALGISALIGAPELTLIASALRVWRELGIPVEALAAQISAMPRRTSRPLLFDKLFNPPALVAADGEFPQPERSFLHPAFRRMAAPAADAALPRLLSGLGVTIDELQAAIEAVAQALVRSDGTACNPDDEATADFPLSMGNLSVLVGAVHLVRALSMSFVELDQVAHPAALRSIGSLMALLEDLATWRLGGYSPDDIVFAGGGRPLDPSPYLDHLAAVPMVIADAAGKVSFSDTVFAVALGIGEHSSRELVHANPDVIEPAPGGQWRLLAGVDLASALLTIPTGTPATVDEVRAVLGLYQPAHVMLRLLAALTRSEAAKLRALIAFHGVDTVALERGIRGDGPVDVLSSTLAWLAQILVYFKSAEWDAVATELFLTRLDLFWMSGNGFTAMAVYTHLARTAAKNGPTGVEHLRAALLSYDTPQTRFPPESDTLIARALGVNEGLIAALRTRLPLHGPALGDLLAIDRAARVATSLGIDGDALLALTSADYSELERGAEALQQALRARRGDGPAAKVEELITEARRDALTTLTLNLYPSEYFDTTNDLYAFLLTDVATGGCGRTSRVVAAIASVQHYVQRIILGLEQDNRLPSDPLHLHVKLSAEARAEWAWRKNYRVWEANRKVFLWPENYLDPDLRADKTPLFEELERELLQTDITDENVREAYVKYLNGFEDVSSLGHAGAYVHNVGAGNQWSDTLHLFGVSASDPPVHYHRTATNLGASRSNPTRAVEWSPWRALGVQIPNRYVSPVMFGEELHLFWTLIATRPVQKVVGGESRFRGYHHTMSLRHSTLRADGTWRTPESIELPSGSESYEWFGPSKGLLTDTFALTTGVDGGHPPLDPIRPVRHHEEPIDDYTVDGPNWEWLWLEPAFQTVAGVTTRVLAVNFRNFVAPGYIDLASRVLRGDRTGVALNARPSFWALAQRATSDGGKLKVGWDNDRYHSSADGWTTSALYGAIADSRRLNRVGVDAGFFAVHATFIADNDLADVPAQAELFSLPGAEYSAILQVDRDMFRLQLTGPVILQRIGTTLAPKLLGTLRTQGVAGLLSVAHQTSLAEPPAPIRNATGLLHNEVRAGSIDHDGPYGAYYREIFHHIPLLIGNALSARGRFADAQRWFAHVFDPTADEDISLVGVPEEDRARRLLDRVWRYVEFRGLGVDRLRSVLTNETALARYRRDPFDPHAIAGLRLSAYQKYAVMRYVRNLVDWGDHLFTQFTTESLNEALQLYIMAQDVLGVRPARLGSCGEAAQPNTYASIRPHLGASTDFLIEVESALLGASARSRRAAAGEPVMASAGTRMIRDQIPWRAAEPASPPGVTAVSGRPTLPRLSSATVADRPTRLRVADDPTVVGGLAPSFAGSLLAQISPAFCIPLNQELLGHWDRVEDRLYKLRHCMDIEGQRRQVALFAPPIDPRLLVRMRAAGLSLDDVLASGSGNLPPYRFLYLIERAKGFASTLAGYGAALLGALEKKDGEEMARLQQVQAQNLARMTTQSMQWEIDAATASLRALERAHAAAVYRRSFHEGRITSGRSDMEDLQSDSRHTASALYGVESALQYLSGVFGALPQIGSPFAMKYGGADKYRSANGFANALHATARVAEAVSASAGLEAGFQRRGEDWKHQRDLADHEIKQLTRQLEAAAIRLQIAERAQATHAAAIEQMQETLELMDGKFTSLGLYTYLATGLRGLHRAAYQNAMSLARLAEQAFRFERGDDTSPGLSATHWDAGRAGLLAGERLLSELQTMERRFLETNYRSLEIDQAVALSQVAPDALVQLRETGECSFAVPELFFDLAYPGHYKRRINAVRLTIPCITGPYTNVSATLTLDRSSIRTRPTVGADALVEHPPRRTTSVATSTAQNDAGVFELSFRDERYMPFEGAGAVSEWTLTLPKTFRQFDYQTINDVILSIAYTAEQDGVLREIVEADNAALEGSIVHHLKGHSIGRIMSLRQEQSAAFTRLLYSPVGTSVPIEITDGHLPMFLRGRPLQVTRAVIAARAAGGATPGSFRLSIDAGAVTGFDADEQLGGLAAASLPGTFGQNLRGAHTFVVEDAGGFAPAVPTPGDPAAIDADRLADLVLYLEYRLA